MPGVSEDNGTGGGDALDFEIAGNGFINIALKIFGGGDSDRVGVIGKRKNTRSSGSAGGKWRTRGNLERTIHRPYAIVGFGLKMKGVLPCLGG